MINLKLVAMAVSLTTSCTGRTQPEPTPEAPAPAALPVGTCFYDGGDFGGTPHIVNCIQAAGKDGYLECFDSRIDDRWIWHGCGEQGFWRIGKRTAVQCPAPCPKLEQPCER